MPEPKTRRPLPETSYYALRILYSSERPVLRFDLFEEIDSQRFLQPPLKPKEFNRKLRSLAHRGYITISEDHELSLTDEGRQLYRTETLRIRTMLFGPQTGDIVH